MKHDMVVFGEDWGRHPSATQHLVKRLSEGRKVLWINSIGLRRPRLNSYDMRRLLEKMRSVTVQRVIRPSSGNNTVPTNMRTLSPIAIPWPGNPVAAHFNRLALSCQIRKEMRAGNISKPLLWCSLPTAVIACDTMKERGVIYYCGDDFSAWQGVDHTPVKEAEKRLVDRSDLIIASSRHLASRFPKEKTLLIEHGVDYSVFSTPAARPDDLPMIGPVAGFFGIINDRINIDIIADAAEKMPHWQFVMIGPIQTDCTRLTSCSNIHLLGKRRYADLAGYVQNWDVSMLPFRHGPDMEASSPLKTREYFAAGTPVASTRFKALTRYQSLVHIAEEEGGFPEALEKAFNDKKRNHLRQQLVANDSWDTQAARIEGVIAAL